MSVRLFVGNLAYDVTEAELRELFSAAGSLLSVRIPTDRETGKPRGFAFVEFNESVQAEEAVRRFHQQLVKGRPLVVNEARPREAGAGARSNASVQVGWSGAPAAAERPVRPSQPTRTFGADAPPRGKRKRKGGGSRGERTPKGPLRERIGGQFFAGGVDDSQGDQVGDDVSFWARDTSDNQDEE